MPDEHTVPGPRLGLEERGTAEQLAFLNSVLEGSTEYSIIAKDLDGTILAWNEGARRAYGYEAADVVGKATVFILHHPEDVKSGRAQEILDETRRTGKWEGQLRRVRKNGSEFSAHVTMTLRRDEAGNPIGFTMISRDLTESERIERELRESQDYNRGLIESNIDALMTTDPLGIITDVNRQMCEMTGFTRDELIGTAFKRYFTDPKRAEDGIRKVLAEDRVTNYELTMRSKAGKETVVSYNATTFRSADGRLKGVFAAARDITDQKRLEEALRQLSSIYDSVADVIYYLAVEPDEQYRFLSVNQAFLTAIGLSEDQVKGKRVLDLVPEPSLSLVLGKYREAIQGRRTLRWEETTPYPKGLKTGEISVTPIFDGEGRCTHLAGTVHDMTERKQGEAERARLTMAVEQAAESIVVTDLEGTIHYVNPAFERISGYTRAEAIGKTPRLLKSGAQDDAFYRRLWGTIARGEAWQGRFVNKRKDGTLYEEEATISPVRDAGGRVVNYVSVQRDLTQERRLEHQLRQAQKMEAIGQLAGGVAHDFNNLLGVITGYGELLLRDASLGPSAHKRVEEIRRSAERAAGLTRQLLAFSRKQVLQPKVLDLNAVVEDVEKMLRRLIGEHIQLVTVFGRELGRVLADPGQIEQVIVNLAVNARDAMPDGGKLILETGNVALDETYVRAHPEARPGSHVLVAVSDTGQGMDAATLAHLFEPFFTTKEPGKGTGLGLATVYGIVKQSGGHVNVYSEPGRGTTFKVYLPRVDAALPDVERLAADAPPRGSETILLAEDAEALRVMIREILESAGYTVLEGGSPEEALSAARSHAGEVHLLLTDVVMPRMSGRTLAAGIHALRPGLKVLYMSGYTDDAIGHHGLLDPGTHFLQKPFTSDALLRKVREVLDASPAGE